MKLLIVVLSLFALTYVSANNAHVYCGRQLSNILAAVCWDNEPMKRDGVSIGFPALDARVLDGYRGKRGPVDECCFKPCTVDELQTYC